MANESRHAVDDAALGADLRRLARAAAPPWLHGAVARRMAERLPAIRMLPERVLQWDAFAGASDALLGAAYPKARRLRVEPTSALLQRARRPWWQRWSAREDEAKLEREVAPSSCQLLWANMALHRTADPLALFAAWQRALAPEGFLMCSGFGPDTLKELRALYACHGWGAPAQDFIDMHDIGDMLVAAGFADPVMDQEQITLIYADAPALLAELRALGGNAAPRRFAGWRTPRWRALLLRGIEGLAGSDGRIGLTFEIVYGHAFRALPRAAAGGETRLSLDEMRAMARTPRRGRDTLR